MDNIKVGIFKIIYHKETKDNKTRITKQFFKVCEYKTNKQNQTKDFIRYKKLYRDWDFYFCDVPINENYYYFNSSKNKIYIN